MRAVPILAPTDVSDPVDVERIRAAFDLPWTGRVVTNNAATTQPPRRLLDLFRRLTLDYENVHLLEHNSNSLPWYGLCREVLPRLSRRVECRVARFDPETGQLDLSHLASIVDSRTKLVCCTGASNFLGVKPPLAEVRRIADARSMYRHWASTTSPSCSASCWHRSGWESSRRKSISCSAHCRSCTAGT